MMLKEIFGDKKIVALAGDKSTGKTNNLMALLKDFRKENDKTNIYVYGLNQTTLKWIMKFKNVYEISSLEHLSNKKDSLIIIDELQSLKLNDRRYTDMLNKFVDFIYHNNNWVILSCPNPREYNSVIGGKIERWLLKSIKLSGCVNGSQLKDEIQNYNGRFKSLNDIETLPNQIVILNKDYEKVIELEYIHEIDDKKNNIDIFDIKKK